ncbi:hypothetical protein ACKKBG_A21800 [Auxenochlorella protothecoides x Auxenochlorella symbiontica]
MVHRLAGDGAWRGAAGAHDDCAGDQTSSFQTADVNFATRLCATDWTTHPLSRSLLRSLETLGSGNGLNS